MRKKKIGKEKEIRGERTNRSEGGGVDGEERDLVNLGPENGDLGIAVGERESGVAGRQLNAAVSEEGIPGCEGNPEGEPVGPLHLRVRARRVHVVVVAAVD